MAFIINKKSTSNGKITLLHYLVENYRTNGKVKRRTILALYKCKTLELFLSAVRAYEVKLLEKLAKHEKELDELIKYGKLPQIYFGRPYRAKQYLVDAITSVQKELEDWQKKKNIAEQNL